MKDNFLEGLLFGYLVFLIVSVAKLYQDYNASCKRIKSLTPYKKLNLNGISFCSEISNHSPAKVIVTQEQNENKKQIFFNKSFNQKIETIQEEDHEQMYQSQSTVGIIDNNFSKIFAQKERQKSPINQQLQSPSHLTKQISQKQLTKRQQQGEDLLKFFLKLYEERNSIQVIREQKGQYTLRAKREQGEPADLLLLEMDCFGVTPAQMFYQFEHLTIEQTKWNTHCKSCELIKVEDGIEIIATVMNIPIVSNRIFVDAKFLWSYPEKDEYMALITSQGNEEIAQDYFQKINLSSSLVVGKTTISGHWFMPIYELGTKRIKGTRIFYANQADPGGSIPNWVKSTFAPKAVVESFEQLATASKKIIL